MLDTITYDYKIPISSGNLKLGDVFDFDGNYIDTSINYEGPNPFCDSKGYLYYLDKEINDTLWVHFESLKDCNDVLFELNKLSESVLQIIFHMMILSKRIDDDIEPRGYL